MMPAGRVTARMASISAGLPSTWVTTTARVRGVIGAGMSAASAVQVSGSTSQKTGVPPQCRMGVMLACQV